MSLPKLTEAVFECYSDIINRDHESDGDFILESLKLVQEENPVLFDFIISWNSRNQHTKKANMHSIIGMLSVYRLLRNQLEVNELEEACDFH